MKNANSFLRNLKILLSAVCIFLILIAFVACDNNQAEVPPVHEHTYVTQKIEPTYTERGYTVYTCECGYSYTSDFVEELGFPVVFKCESDVQGKIEGESLQYIKSGEESAVVKAVANAGFRFKCWSDGNESDELVVANVLKETQYTAYFEKQICELPIIEINTEGFTPITSKEDYLSCDISVSNAEEDFCFENYTAQIRGRGNSSWNAMPKKSYKLQFVKSDTNGKKVDLFGNGEAKTWTLIANYCDKSLIRNYLAYSVGDLFGEEIYTSTTQFVDLYLNCEYLGVYLVCEQIQTGKNRVDIAEDLVDKKNNPIAPQDVGYLLEMDGRASEEGEENKDYFVVENQEYAIKTPDVDDENFSTEYVEYIKSYLGDCIDALKSGNYETVKSLIDVDTFASCYIVHELFNCVDCGFTSFFLNKDKGSKLCCGPIWDFDVSSGNCNYNNSTIEGDISSPTLMWAKASNVWYKYLLTYQEFNQLVGSKIAENEKAITDKIERCIDNVLLYKTSFERNFEKWQIMGAYVWPNTTEIIKITEWKEQVRYVEWWLKRSLNCLKSEYCK